MAPDTLHPRVAIGPAFGEFGGVSQHVRNLARESAFAPEVFRLAPWSFFHPAWRRAFWILETNRIRFPDPWLLSKIRGLRRADLVHLHAYPFWIEAFLTRGKRKPKVVYTVHQVFQREDVPAHEWPRWRALNARLFEGCRASDAVISVARWQQELLRKEGIDAVVVPNGVDVSAVLRGDAGRFAKRYGIQEPFYLSAMALLKYKRPEHLAALAERLPDRLFVAVGKGMTPDGLRAYLGRAIPPNLRALGEVPREDLLDAFAACRAFVLTSTHDTFPTALLEAMAAGKPVVASATAGPGEIVVDGRSGFHFRPEDVASLEAAARRAWDAPETVHRAAKERADAFAWPAVASKVDDVYRKLLGVDP